uniref:NADH-ubiquinone oxidoreductase chain 6 n=1 Tax=Sclomina erinacea TaxID=1524606 RepID=A0A7T7FP73_9HEMI|nr:NADH dehydrogenase subunit 6 [Sclomina erinacea]QQL93413.1 NADH dehydrogenase subunit 6 [Sclomina erinacea]WGT86907.1 NADH dehydrogenase subunit 6 [Sclomina erinacea]WGT86920.1 NADH dehydrogenase subunit 6 [Sclomina erinacea]WGT86933.1 NADH dehydrogenase subunit 6 [Sclomina erinacea]WGT86946.1 NADH dehydrogenase subunit 6 [Sclomina erinacea]
MMTNLLITTSITISITFMFLKHPLSMGLALIMQTINVSLITGMMIDTFWFSYILLITMLSGALVLFIYMASIASNEKFHTSITMMLFIITSMSTVLVLTLLKTQPNMTETIKKMNLNNEQVLSLIKMFNMHNMIITLTMIIYLFMTMVVISYIVNVHEGPLRMKN